MILDITVQNSECQLKYTNTEVDKLLKTNLSYEDKNVQFSLAKARKRIKQINELLDSKSGFQLDRQVLEKELSINLRNIRFLERKLHISLYKDRTFPTGLLPRVLELLNSYELKISDLRKVPKLKQHKFVLKENLPALRYYQKEATKQLEEHGRGIVVMPTGTGKTTVIAKMIWDLGVNTLIITPSKSITDMMISTMTKHFGKGKVSKLKTKTKKIDKPINIVNIQALIKMDPNVLSSIDAVFIDEFHHSAADTYREVNLKHLKNCYYRIGLTATNFRNDGADIALESVLSNILYEYSIKQALKDKYLVKPEFEIIETEISECKNFMESYKQNIVENQIRNELIAQIAEAHKQDHVIILVKEIEHGNILKELIANASFINGKEKDSIRERMLEDFNKGKIKCLIGTSVIGEGVDLPIADVLIMAGGGKAAGQIMQNIGRVLRIFKGKLKALVYDFTDDGCRWLKAHSEIRKDIYQNNYL